MADTKKLNQINIISTKDETVLANSILLLPSNLDFLLCPIDGEEMLPPGIAFKDEDHIIYLNKISLNMDKVRVDTKLTKGCCGADGFDFNVFNKETNEPLAIEFSDCWGSHAIHVPRFLYHIKDDLHENSSIKEDDENIQERYILLESIQVKNKRYLINIDINVFFGGVELQHGTDDKLRRMFPELKGDYSSLKREVHFFTTQKAFFELFDKKCIWFERE